MLSSELEVLQIYSSRRERGRLSSSANSVRDIPDGATISIFRKFADTFIV